MILIWHVTWFRAQICGSIILFALTKPAAPVDRKPRLMDNQIVVSLMAGGPKATTARMVGLLVKSANITIKTCRPKPIACHSIGYWKRRLSQPIMIVDLMAFLIGGLRS